MAKKKFLELKQRAQTPAEKRAKVFLKSRVPIGWTEWVALPSLGVSSLKAKVDTGARTSALHVVAMNEVPGEPDLLNISLELRRGEGLTEARVRVLERVLVRTSNGAEELRPVIQTALLLGGYRLRVRLSLTDRGGMLCPMLLGRTALSDRFAVVPEARFLLGHPGRL